MACSIGVKKEVKMAKDNNVPIFGVYIVGTDSYSNLPEGSARNRVIKYPYSPFWRG